MLESNEGDKNWLEIYQIVLLLSGTSGYPAFNMVYDLWGIKNRDNQGMTLGPVTQPHLEHVRNTNSSDPSSDSGTLVWKSATHGLTSPTGSFDALSSLGATDLEPQFIVCGDSWSL